MMNFLFVSSQDDDENKKKYVCQYCGKMFLSKTGHRNHIAQNHVLELKKHICSWKVCLLIKRYVQVQILNNTYCIQDCERRFYSLTELEIHHRTHTGERPFVCSFCGDSFISKSAMNVHERKVHEAKGNYGPVSVRLHYATKPCDVGRMTVWSLLIIG